MVYYIIYYYTIHIIPYLHILTIWEAALGEAAKAALGDCCCLSLSPEAMPNRPNIRSRYAFMVKYDSAIIIFCDVIFCDVLY